VSTPAPERVVAAESVAAPEPVVAPEPVAPAQPLAMEERAVEALTREPELLRIALRDRLHQDARLELVPESADLFEDLRKAHIPVCVSGAGPSLLAFPLSGDEVPEHLLPPSWRALAVPIRREGFTVDG
jgi:homoserine kinase